MSFESGSISCRILYLPRELPGDAIDRFARDAAPPINTLGDGGIHGWVTGRHLLDRHITADTAFYGGYLRLALLQAERKIPESLLRAECKMEELARLQADGGERLGARVRREIREEISRRLLPTMPPTLKGIAMLYDTRARLLYTTALSDKQLDAFQVSFAQTIGFGAIPVLPETAAIQRLKINVRDWTPCSFSPEAEPDEVRPEPAYDFLTWLWFCAEARGGLFKLGDLGDWAVMVEGPLTLLGEGPGAHEAVVRQGEPLRSAETKAALLAGKKLRRAKLTLARQDQSFTCTFDAERFAIRGLKLPDGEKLDAVSKFQERMQQLDQFQAALLAFFDRFARDRQTPATWKTTLAELHTWVKDRPVRD